MEARKREQDILFITFASLSRELHHKVRKRCFEDTLNQKKIVKNSQKKKKQKRANKQERKGMAMKKE